LESEGVKSFGQMLIDDHGEANKKAIDVAKANNVNAPNGPNARQNADYARMSKMTGAAFDKSFVQHMIADHKKDIAAYKKEARQTDSAGQYAQEALPTLEKHLDTAQEPAGPFKTLIHKVAVAVEPKGGGSRYRLGSTQEYAVRRPLPLVW